VSAEFRCFRNIRATDSPWRRRASLVTHALHRADSCQDADRRSANAAGDCQASTRQTRIAQRAQARPSGHSAYCPTIRTRSAVDFWHGIYAAATCLSAYSYRAGSIGISCSSSSFSKRKIGCLEKRLSGKRIRFNDAERALLARKAKAVGRRALLKLDTIVSPDTLMRWNRRLVAQKSNSPIDVGLAEPASCVIFRS
jgi:hypothetical protein